MVANSKRDCLVDLAFLLSLQNELWSENHLVVQLILLFWYPASVEEEDYFAVWHCWKERKRLQIRGRSIHFSPANRTMKIMGLEIKALGVKQVVAKSLHKCVCFGVAVMFGNSSMALVNAETLLPSASWWTLRQHFSDVWYKWRTKISKNGVLRWFEHWGCRKIAFTWLAFRSMNSSSLVALGPDSDQKRAYIHMIRQLQLSSWRCKVNTPLVTSIVWHRWKTKDHVFLSC